jgi:hypothetical protein
VIFDFAMKKTSPRPMIQGLLLCDSCKISNLKFAEVDSKDTSSGLSKNKIKNIKGV